MGECWGFLGFRNLSGYGQMTEGGRVVGAHRVAWELANGPIPPGLEVCHSCDNPPCCNPDHLFLGTHAENMTDAGRKGRAWRRGDQNEANANHRLSDIQVAAIRQRYAAGGVSQRSLAREFGVTQAQVWNIVHHRQRRIG